MNPPFLKMCGVVSLAKVINQAVFTKNSQKIVVNHIINSYLYMQVQKLLPCDAALG